MPGSQFQSCNPCCHPVWLSHPLPICISHCDLCALSWAVDPKLSVGLCLHSLTEQVSLSTGTKKLLAATAFGAVSLIYLARRFRRRKGKKKASSPVEQETFEFLTTVPLKKGTCRLQITFNQQWVLLQLKWFNAEIYSVHFYCMQTFGIRNIILKEINFIHPGQLRLL